MKEDLLCRRVLMALQFDVSFPQRPEDVEGEDQLTWKGLAAVLFPGGGIEPSPEVSL